MVDSVNKLIANYQSKLTSTELEQFKSMPEDKQLAIAMLKTDKAAPTDLGALSNLDAKPGAKSTDGIFSKGEPPEENSTGLVIERKGAPYVDDKTGLPSTEKPKENPPASKTTQYAVQLGDSIEVVVKKSLKAQGIDAPDEKQLKEATEKFIADNGGVSKKGLIKENKNGVKFLSAGSTVKLDGEVKFDKTAKQVEKAWAEKYAKQPANTTEKSAGDTAKQAETGTKPAGTKLAPAKQTGTTDTKLQTMSDSEIKEFNKKHPEYKEKNITIDKYRKDPKTGEVSVMYSKDGHRTLRLYDANGNNTALKTYYKDKTVEVMTGSSGKYNFAKKEKICPDGTRVLYKDDGKGGWEEIKTTPTKAAPATAKGKIVTPTAEETNGIAKQEGGKFIKNTKTGLISQIYDENGIRTVQTYDKNKKSVQTDTYSKYNDHTFVESYKDGKRLSAERRYKDGTVKHYNNNLEEVKPAHAETKNVAEAKAAEKVASVKPEVQTKANGENFVKDKSTGLFSKTYTENGVLKVAKYDAGKHLKSLESKYSSGDVVTTLYQNGKISKKTLKTKDSETTFEGYIDDKTPTKATKTINGKKETSTWNSKEEEWVKDIDKNAKEVIKSTYKHGKLFQKEITHKDGSTEFLDGYNPVPGGKMDFTLKVLTDTKGRKTYYQRDPQNGDYNKIR